MATSEMESKENITCSICLDTLQNPHALACLHNFCGKCLTEMKSKREKNDRGITCPVCKQFTPDASIKHNAIMEQLVAVLSKFYEENILNQPGIKDKFCVQCDSSNVKSYCMDCKVDLCANCCTRHLRLPACSEHNIVPVEESATEGSINIVKYCPNHPTKPIKVNCVPCQKAICSDCKLEEHDTHQTETIEAAMDKLLPVVKEKLKALSLQNEILEDKRQLLLSRTQTVQQNVDEVLQQLDDDKEAKMNQLNKAYDTLKETVINHKQAISKESSLLVADVNNLKSSTESILSWANMLVDMTSGPALLFELQSDVNQRMDGVLEDGTKSDVVDAFIDKTKIKASFLPCELQSKDVVGRMTFDRADESRGSKPKMESGTTKNTMLPASLHLSSQANIMSNRYAGISIKNFAGKSKKKDKKIKLRATGNILCYFQGTIFVTNYNRIDVYSKAGDYIRTIQCKHDNDIGSVRGLHPFSPNQMLVAADTGLHLIDIGTGVSTHHILPGKMRDLSAAGKVIVVLEAEEPKHKIHILQITEQSLKVVTSFLLPDSYTTRILLHKENLYISYYTSITLFSLDGKVLRKYGNYGKRGAGAMRSPHLCGADKDGNILIADKNNDRLQLLSPSGEITLVKGVQLKCPIDAFFADECLYVLYGEYWGDKIQVYR